jgi:uncharacterized protein
MIILATLLILIGLVAGSMIGVIGVGAGVIMVPSMVAIGIPIKEAVAITLAMQTLPVGIFGVLEYYKKGYIKWVNVALVAVGMILGISIGSYFGSTKSIFSDKTLHYMLGFTAISIGIYTIVNA